MNALIRILVYFGFGALAHWLWLGSHFDPNDVFTWVCLLLGFVMVLAWVVKVAAWWMLVLAALGMLATAAGAMAAYLIFAIFYMLITGYRI